MAVDGLIAVRGRIAAAADRAGRDPADVTLVVVTKGRSDAEVMALHGAGHRHFGENRAQALAERAARLPADIVWHFVGPLQSNKAALVSTHAAWLHSLDRRKLAGRWGPGSPPALLQVNVGREPQKSGVDPDAAVALYGELLAEGVPLRGLMAIPPKPADPGDSRPHFRQLAALAAALRHGAARHHLSMGMSDDYEVAVEEGATMLRVGRAIFEWQQREG